MALSWLNSGIGGTTAGQGSNPYTTGGYLDPTMWQQLPAFAQKDPNGFTLYKNMQSGAMRGSKGTVGSEGFTLADFADKPFEQPAAQLPAAPPAMTSSPGDTIDWASLLGTANQAPAANPQYTSGITAGRINSPEQQAAATRAVSGVQAQMPGVYGVPASAGQMGSMNNQLGGLMAQFGQRNANTLDRGQSAANAQQLLASQTARAQSGVSGGNLLQQLYDMQLRNQVAQTQPLMSLLSSFLR